MSLSACSIRGNTVSIKLIGEIFPLFLEELEKDWYYVFFHCEGSWTFLIGRFEITSLISLFFTCPFKISVS